MDFFCARPARVRVAILLSVAVHLCVLTLLAYLCGGTPIVPGTLAGDTSVLAVSTIVLEPAAPPATPRTRIARSPSVDASLRHQPIAAVTQRHVAASTRLTIVVSHATIAPRRAAPRTTRVGTATYRLAPPPRVTRQSAVWTRPATVVTHVAVIAPPPPTATPVAAPSPRSTGAAVAAGAPETFSGLFSQNYPPALPAPTIVEAIRSRLSGHGRIRIDVDESGHATEVQFIGSIPDEAAQDVRSQLLDATYVPADCNGLRCDGTLEISY